MLKFFLKFLMLILLPWVQACGRLDNNVNIGILNCGSIPSDPNLRLLVPRLPPPVAQQDLQNIQAFEVSDQGWQELPMTEKGCAIVSGEQPQPELTYVLAGRIGNNYFFGADSGLLGSDLYFVELRTLTSSQLARIHLPPPKSSRFTRHESEPLFDILENHEGYFPGLVHFEMKNPAGTLQRQVFHAYSRASDVRLSLVGLSDGNYQVNYRYQDLFGRSQDISGDFQLIVDRISPVLTLGDQELGHRAVSLNPGEEIRLALATKAPWPLEICQGTDERNCTFHPFDGTYRAPEYGSENLIIRVLDQTNQVLITQHLYVRVFDQNAINRSLELMNSAIQQSGDSHLALQLMDQALDVYASLSKRPEESRVLELALEPKIIELGAQLRLLNRWDLGDLIYRRMSRSETALLTRRIEGGVELTLFHVRSGQKFAHTIIGSGLDSIEYFEESDNFLVKTNELEFIWIHAASMEISNQVSLPDCVLLEVDVANESVICLGLNENLSVFNSSGDLQLDLKIVKQAQEELHQALLVPDFRLLALLGTKQLYLLDLDSGSWQVVQLNGLEHPVHRIDLGLSGSNVLLSYEGTELKYSILFLDNFEISAPYSSRDSFLASFRSRQVCPNRQVFVFPSETKIHVINFFGDWIARADFHSEDVLSLKFASAEQGAMLASLDYDGMAIISNDFTQPASRFELGRRNYWELDFSAANVNPSLVLVGSQYLDEYRLSNFLALESAHFGDHIVSMKTSSQSTASYLLSDRGDLFYTSVPTMETSLIYQHDQEAEAVGFCLGDQDQTQMIFFRTGVQIIGRNGKQWHPSEQFQIAKVECGPKIRAVVQMISFPGRGSYDAIFEWNPWSNTWDLIYHGESFLHVQFVNDGFLIVRGKVASELWLNGSLAQVLDDYEYRGTHLISKSVAYDSGHNVLAYRSKNGLVIYDLNQHEKQKIPLTAHAEVIEIANGKVYAAGGPRLLVYQNKIIDQDLQASAIRDLRVIGNKLVSVDSSSHVDIWNLTDARPEIFLSQQLRQTSLVDLGASLNDDYLLFAGFASRFGAIDQRLIALPLNMSSASEAIRSSAQPMQSQK